MTTYVAVGKRTAAVEGPEKVKGETMYPCLNSSHEHRANLKVYAPWSRNGLGAVDAPCGKKDQSAAYFLPMRRTRSPACT